MHAITSFLTRASRSTGLTVAETRAAEFLLGRKHALTRALANQHTVAVQSVVAMLAVAAAAVGVLVSVRHATLLVFVALSICAGFVVVWSIMRQIVSDRARDLIAGGRDTVVLAVVVRERRSLASRKVRERLAGALEAFHRDALRWHERLPQCRPPHEVLQLRHATREVEAVTAALRRDCARVQGVALASQLISDGDRSPLYAGALRPLREELNRIRYLLESGDDVEPDDTQTARRAA